MEKSEVTYDNPAFQKEGIENLETPLAVKTASETPETTKPQSLTKEERLKELRSIRWNILLISICSVLVASPMNGLMNSTLSLLSDEGLGITSLAASSVAQFLGSAFLLSYVNKIIGVRRMISITLILPMAFILSFAYPSWYTTLPACIILGLSMASLTSSFMYGSALGFYYAKLSNGNSNNILVIITAFLACTFGSGHLIGNGIVFAVFNIGLEDDNSSVSGDTSFEVCGANYCNEVLTNMTTMKQPDTFRYYTLVGVFGVMSAVGGIMSLFIRNFSCELGYVFRKKSEYFTIMKETLGLLKRPRGYLLIILTIFVGLEQAFIASVYTHAYISCTVGIPKVGLIMMSYGAVQIVVMLTQGIFLRLLGRIFLIACGTSMVIGICVVLLLWMPDPSQIGIFFAITTVWSASDAAITPSLFALYGILFEDNIEGSLSLGTFWWGVGFMLAFVWSQFLCVYFKLYITIGVGCVGLICYLVLEWMIRRNNKSDFKLRFFEQKRES